MTEERVAEALKSLSAIAVMMEEAARSLSQIASDVSAIREDYYPDKRRQKSISTPRGPRRE